MTLLSRLRSFFASTGELDEAALEQLERQRLERADATRRDNLLFDRHGPHEFDLLPGSKRARLFRRGRRR